MFMKIYHHYKTTFDLEMRLTHANVTYEEARLKAMEEEEWIK